MKIQTGTNVSNPVVECDWTFNRPTSSHTICRRKTNLKISVHLERRCHATAQARPLPTNTKGLVKVTWIPRGIKTLRWYFSCAGHMADYLSYWLSYVNIVGGPVGFVCLLEGHDFRSGVGLRHMTWTQIRWESWIRSGTSLWNQRLAISLGIWLRILPQRSKP